MSEEKRKNRGVSELWTLGEPLLAGAAVWALPFGDVTWRMSAGAFAVSAAKVLASSGLLFRKWKSRPNTVTVRVRPDGLHLGQRGVLMYERLVEPYLLAAASSKVERRRNGSFQTSGPPWARCERVVRVAQAPTQNAGKPTRFCRGAA
jgi:hypothetical protein